MGLGSIFLTLTSRSLEDPAALSAEELIDGSDPVDPAAAVADVVAVSDSDVAFLAYPSTTTTVAAVTMTHADLVTAMARVADNDGGRQV